LEGRGRQNDNLRELWRRPKKRCSQPALDNLNATIYRSSTHSSMSTDAAMVSTGVASVLTIPSVATVSGEVSKVSPGGQLLVSSKIVLEYPRAHKVLAQRCADLRFGQ
jgi:uncharacterized protein YhdP